MKRNASVSNGSSVPAKATWRNEPTYRAAIAFGLSLFATLRIRFRVRGDEHFPAEGAAILAITHFGYLDFALTERCFWKKRRRLMRFMATAGSFRHKISGPLMRGMHHIPVDRAAGEKSFEPTLEALARGEKHGYRNAQVTVIAPTGTIGLLMDCDTTGVEPDFALVKFKKLAGGAV